MSALNILNIGGGIALILFGVRFLRKGLDRLFGPRLAIWMNRMAGTWPRAFASGFATSLIAPSSTTISTLAVQTLDSGALTARQMLAVIFGANIGMTTLVILGSLNINVISSPLLFVGLIFYQFTRRRISRGLGQFTMALGFIFLGISLIKISAEIDPNGALAQVIRIVDGYPIVLTIIAAGLALAMQSSTATILFMASLGGTGLVYPRTAIAGVAGANIGIAITTLILGWHLLEAKRLALGNFLVKLLVTILCLGLMGWLVTLFENAPGPVMLRIGYTHTLFNIAVAMIGMPLIPLLNRLLKVWLPESKDNKFGPKYIKEGTTDSIALSLGQSRREILRVSEMTIAMFDDLWTALSTNNESRVTNIKERDDKIDFLDESIKRFLTSLAHEGLDSSELTEQMRQLRYASELETIGDILDKNISQLVLKKIRLGLQFSEEGWDELDNFAKKVRENMIIAETAFHTRSETLAKQLLRHKGKLGIQYRDLRDHHLERLNARLMQSHETSAIHLDLLTHLKRINSCVSPIAYAVLDEDEPVSDNNKILPNR